MVDTSGTGNRGPSSGGDDVDAQLSGLRDSAAAALRLGEYARAFQIYQEILGVGRANTEDLGMAAAVAGEAGEIDTGLELIDSALKRAPDNHSLHYNKGLLLKKQGRLDEAIECYRAAISLRPDFSAAFFNIASACTAKGDSSEAIAYLKEALRTRPDYSRALWALCELLLQQGRTNETIELCWQYGGAQQDSRQLLVYLARALGSGAADRVREDAVDPTEIYLGLARFFYGRNDFQKALACYQKVLAGDPRHVRANHQAGLILQHYGRLAEAVTHYTKVLDVEAEHVDALYHLAAAYESLNRLDEAEAAVRRALAVSPEHAHARLVAAKILVRRKRPDEALGMLQDTDFPDEFAHKFHFELGYIYDQLNETDKAFDQFTEGNRRLEEAYEAIGEAGDKSRFLDTIAALESWVDGSRFRPPAVGAQVSGEVMPVFLVGFPRSGTTLLDQILDSHREIRVMEETPVLNHVVSSVASMPSGYPDSVATLTDEDARSLREQYLAMAGQVVGDPSAAVLVDKMPLNIVHVPLAARLFPEAKFVIAIRHPCDVCLSCFMQAFRQNDAMANFNTLEDSAALYDRVMTLWRRYAGQLPIPHHVVKYEGLVEDYQSEARALFDFLGLDYDGEAEAFWEHARTRSMINTPSYRQVTRPIYGSARYRWLRYRRHLEPVLPVLAPHIEYFGYDPC